MERISSKASISEKEIESRVPSKHQQYPWLVLTDGENRERQVFYSVGDDQYYEKYIPELQNNYIACSTHKQWLALQDKATWDIFLLNISKMEKVKIPLRLDKISGFSVCALSSSPTMDSTCHVMIFSTCNPRNFLSYKLGETTCSKVDLLLDDDAVRAAINFEGKLHVLTYSYCLMFADYSDPDLRFTKLISTPSPNLGLLPLDKNIRVYLVESSGDLLFIYRRHRDRELVDIKILKADFTNREWVFEENLGDRAIFLDKNHSYSSPASAFGLKGNCVYFVNKIGRNLFVYDLEDESVSISLPCPDVSFNSSLTWITVLDS